MDYKDTLAQYIAATNTHDFSNVQPLLDPAAVYWFTDKTCTSLEEIKNYFEQAWQRGSIQCSGRNMDRGWERRGRMHLYV